MADFTSAIRFLIGVAFTNHNPFQSKGVSYITVRMFFNENFEVSHGLYYNASPKNSIITE